MHKNLITLLSLFAFLGINSVDAGVFRRGSSGTSDQPTPPKVTKVEPKVELKSDIPVPVISKPKIDLKPESKPELKTPPIPTNIEDISVSAEEINKIIADTIEITDTNLKASLPKLPQASINFKLANKPATAALIFQKPILTLIAKQPIKPEEVPTPKVQAPPIPKAPPDPAPEPEQPPAEKIAPEAVTAPDEFPTPPVIIQSAETIKIGDVVDLKVKPLDKIPENLYSVSYTWTVLPQKDIIAWSDSSRILFGTGDQPTSYTIIVSAVYVYVVTKDDKFVKAVQRTNTVTKEIQIGRPQLNPGEGSTELPELSIQVLGWIDNIKRSEVYNSPRIKDDAKQVSASFRLIAGLISSGGLTDVGSVIKATKDANDKLPINKDAWAPWFQRVTEYLDVSYNNGSIKSLDQFKTAWESIATGLEAIKP